MRTIHLVPAICQPHGETPALYAGHVELKRLSFDERCEIAEQSGLDTIDLSKANINDISFLKVIRKTVAATKECFIEIKLKRLSDGLEFNSYDDLQYEPDFSSVLTQAAMTLVRGDVPTKK